jgi:rod shape-determining protein MreC
VKFRRYGLLIAVLLVCLVLLTVQTRGGGTGRAADVVSILTTPVQIVLTKIHRGAVSLWVGYREWRVSWSENEQLRAENERLRVQSLQVAETREENDRLRRLLGLRQRLPMTTMSGEGIGREGGGWIRSLTVNRGRGDNVPRLTAVISPNGLIGRVVDVRPGVSIVQVLTDPTSTVGAHVLRTRTPGIVEGDPRGTLRFKFMARDGASIQSGDVLVTAGQGGLFPRGIPIGTVRSIDNRGAALFHYAELTPTVDFARVDEVLLVTGDSQRDLTAFFPTGG